MCSALLVTLPGGTPKPTSPVLMRQRSASICGPGNAVSDRLFAAITRPLAEISAAEVPSPPGKGSPKPEKTWADREEALTKRTPQAAFAMDPRIEIFIGVAWSKNRNPPNAASQTRRSRPRSAFGQLSPPARFLVQKTFAAGRHDNLSGSGIVRRQSRTTRRYAEGFLLCPRPRFVHRRPGRANGKFHGTDAPAPFSRDQWPRHRFLLRRPALHGRLGRRRSPPPDRRPGLCDVSAFFRRRRATRLHRAIRWQHRSLCHARRRRSAQAPDLHRHARPRRCGGPDGTEQHCPGLDEHPAADRLPFAHAVVRRFCRPALFGRTRCRAAAAIASAARRLCLIFSRRFKNGL